MNSNALSKLYALLCHLEGAYAPNTLRAYKTDMLEFINYCSKIEQPSLPATPSTVARFLLETINQGIKSSTIRRKASSISAIHRLSSFQDPTKHPEVKITLRKINRQLGTRFDQASPINRPLLERMLAVCGDDLRGLRNQVLLLIAYESMRRRSELISLRVEDIEWTDNGASILLRKSKTDQNGCGKWIHLSKRASQTLQTWLATANFHSGFILRGIRPNGSVSDSLCGSRVTRIFKALARKSGVHERTVSEISGHSMRVGGAQDLLSDGASLPQIMIKGGWAKTDTVMRYVERIRPTNGH